MVVHGVADEFVRAGADWMLTEVGTCARGHNLRGPCELNGERRERLFQLELDPVIVERLDALEAAIRPLGRRDGRGIDHLAVGKHDVLRSEFVTVVEFHSAPQRDDVGERIGIVHTLRQHRSWPEVRPDCQQGVEDQLRHALGCLVAAETGIEVVGAGANADDDGAGRHGGLWGSAGG